MPLMYVIAYCPPKNSAPFGSCSRNKDLSIYLFEDGRRRTLRRKISRKQKRVVNTIVAVALKDNQIVQFKERIFKKPKEDKT